MIHERKRAIVVIISCIMLLFFCTKVQAKDSIISFSGDENIEVSKQQIISLKISSDKNIGVIQGRINGGTNIEIVDVVAKNQKWVTNFNNVTNQFNVYYANGAKEGEIIDIKYKLKDGSKSGTISIDKIELTTTSYETINVDGINKTITAKIADDVDKESKSSNYTETTSTENANNNSKNSSNEIIPKLGQDKIIAICFFVALFVVIVSRSKMKGNRRK